MMIFQTYGMAEKTGTIKFAESIDPKVIFKQEIVDRIKNGERVEASPGSFLSYDNDRNVIRLQNYRNQLDYVTVNFWLTEEGKIREISRAEKNDRHGLVAPLVANESCLGPGAFATLGITDNEKQQTLSKNNEIRKIEKEFEGLNNSNISSLANSYEYSGKTTKGVMQGDATIISPDGKTDGLYTFGAGPCSIVIAVSRDQFTGEVKKIGMAHVDAMVTAESITNFLNSVKGTGPNKLDISIVSGESKTALSVYELAKNTGDIKFMNCDIDGQRSDAAIVDKTGRIYYGGREDFNNDRRMFNPIALQLVAMRFSPTPLGIKGEE